MSGQTWMMGKALGELMQRHQQTLSSPVLVPLSDPAEGPLMLSGMASTLDVDIERVAFAPFAFEWTGNVPLMFDHTDQVAGRIELLDFSSKGELQIRAYVEHPMAVRCNAFSVSCDVLDFTLHRTDSPQFFARAEKVRLREVSLVPAPIQRNARVLKREAADADCASSPRSTTISIL